MPTNRLLRVQAIQVWTCPGGGGLYSAVKVEQCPFLVRRTAGVGGGIPDQNVSPKDFYFVFMSSRVGSLAACSLKFKVYWKLKETSIMIQFVQILQSANITDIVWRLT